MSEEKKIDYRYETPNEIRDFHRRRRAFIILNGILEFLPENSTMSHFEYCESKGLDKKIFNKIIRGYYLNGKVVFYKDNFTYDEDLIKESLKYLKEISLKVSTAELEIYFGQLPDQNFALDYYYGKYSEGKITK